MRADAKHVIQKASDLVLIFVFEVEGEFPWHADAMVHQVSDGQARKIFFNKQAAEICLPVHAMRLSAQDGLPRQGFHYRHVHGPVPKRPSDEIRGIFKHLVSLR
ncbi:hypothetical protein GCM10019071_15120 [Sphingobium fuliginis]|uniref:Uncharacterized protein n=1 Tax=Sphingobium fuliginis (strain ATCC 27551) TaxID=336203 RepID=A0ABQ1ETE8_SPHSA|nr:hypothetical protein GCM10019071_15120 [Sphingobium fuliginis]